MYLPYEQKTIKPVDWGGVAGGQKYVVHEILFKFAYDQIGLFKGIFFFFFDFLFEFVFDILIHFLNNFSGNNLAAAKVGGHELKGLMSYYSLGMQVSYSTITSVLISLF